MIPARARLLVVEIVGPDADGQAVGELRVLDMRTEVAYRRLVAANGFRLSRVAPLRARSPWPRVGPA